MTYKIKFIKPYEQTIDDKTLGYSIGDEVEVYSQEERKNLLDNGIAVKVDKINVLDHGFVRLIDSMGSDLSIVRAARVSYDAAWRAGEDSGSDIKLINYLWKNHHTTPFEAVSFTFEIKAPIFVFRQWHRHRTWSYNELSARYRELPEEYYVPNINHIGEQSKSSKQARVFDNSISAEPDIIKLNQLEEYEQTILESFKTYKMLIEAGWPKELARGVLPVSTYSHMFCSVNLLNLLKFLTLRCHEHAQYEIRVYAEAMLELITSVVPEAVRAWKSTNNK